MRIGSPLVTLWYLVWQRLHPRHTLEAVVADARGAGADHLVPKGKKLSQKIKSRATTAFLDARQRLSLAWLRDCFTKLARQLRAVGEPLAIEVLDGSTVRLRPHGDIARDFPPHRTRARRSSWCVARVLVSFCARTGVATGALLASLDQSEQALAVQPVLAADRLVLQVGDRNFGVWRVVRAASQGGGHALVRLTRVRARRLLGKKRRPGFWDHACRWTPTTRDQVDKGLTKAPVAGRVVVIQAARPGCRPQTLYLFTTLTDTQAYPPKRLLEIYGWRWQAELNFRAFKDTLEMDQATAHSTDMVRKEFYAGLMAYNLVRGLMAAAADQTGGHPAELCFAKVRLLLAAVIFQRSRKGRSRAAAHQRLRWLLAEAATARLPRRSKPRPSEHRAQYYEPQVFPKMQGARAAIRRKLKKHPAKS